MPLGIVIGSRLRSAPAGGGGERLVRRFAVADQCPLTIAIVSPGIPDDALDERGVGLRAGRASSSRGASPDRRSRTGLRRHSHTRRPTAPSGGRKTVTSPSAGSPPRRWLKRSRRMRWPGLRVGTIDAEGIRYGLTASAWMVARRTAPPRRAGRVRPTSGAWTRLPRSTVLSPRRNTRTRRRDRSASGRAAGAFTSAIAGSTPRRQASSSSVIIRPVRRLVGDRKDGGDHGLPSRTRRPPR